ncbi:hypothetical protein LTR99_010396 [Exophiala xenobiotica]|uniref:Cytochrome P450 n=1 Tax=Vermiconidia calcicola TaxID=1690605 RepID=A0AAV9Q244_9PEZI|nr:hypothetical protein LTR92_007020 [Exophiala xenobiotica]KAK5530259.1 hypothetical protein LTR23_010417 [Chaetothyriales sp. CCFEE 6169]KAK5534115.1 hypothetical protein LTR25_007095 [Vermiconidia calcicola]KAK5219373.1 hypothetical protein LTR72_007757 [Exophiala xenobiotica]KAK5264106.1 hypothetical protein LTR96_010614 [Exophiala xenobiotica]
MMLAIVSAVALAWLCLYPVIRYYLDPKKLRRFPAPSVAAYTPLWGMYYTWKGDQWKHIEKAHAQLGSVVRIAPNHVSFTDPVAYKEIYGFGNTIIKDDFYAHIGDGNPSMAQTTDKAAHSTKRRYLAHVFSAKEVVAMEPRVMELVYKLCEKLKIKTDGRKIGPDDEYETVKGVVDIRPWLNMFTYDAITSMFFTNSYGFLDRGNDLCPSLDESGKVDMVHGMDAFHSASGFNTLMAPLPLQLYKLGRKLLAYSHGCRAGSWFLGMSRYQVTHRIENEPDKPDLFSKFPSKPTEKKPDPMPVSEIIAECATMLDAGNDTTQTSLTMCIYHLAKYPQVQKKLFTELSKEVRPEYATTKVLPSQVVQSVPYLRAVLDENWRCQPPVTRGLPRRTVEGGATIAGHFIPAGTTISAPTYNLHHNHELFRRADEFIPERWIATEAFGADETERQNLKDFVIPFSLGPRACIGRNLAYMEVSITIAALVLNFEFELADTYQEMETIERFNCNPAQLVLKISPR